MLEFKGCEDDTSSTPSIDGIASDASASAQNQIWPHVTVSSTKSTEMMAMQTNEKQNESELSPSAHFDQPNHCERAFALQTFLQPEQVFPRSIQQNVAEVPSLYQQLDTEDLVAPTSATIQQTLAALPSVYGLKSGSLGFQGQNCQAGSELTTHVDPMSDASLFDMLFKITEGDQSIATSTEDPYEPAPINPPPRDCS